jgi:hypothetical protein
VADLRVELSVKGQIQLTSNDRLFFVQL